MPPGDPTDPKPSDPKPILESDRIDADSYAKATVAAKNYKDQIDALEQAILGGKNSLDAYISKMQALVSIQVEAKKEIGGFYQGISVANEKLQEEIKLLDEVSTALESSYRKNLRETIDLTDNLSKSLKDYNITQDELKQNQEEIIKNLQEQQKLKQEEIVALDEIIKSSKSFEDIQKAKDERTKAELILNQNNEIIQRSLIVLRAQQTAARIQEIEQNNQLLPQLMSENNLRKLQGESIQGVSKATVGLSDKLLGASSQSNIFTSAMLSMSAPGKTLTNIFGALGESFLSPQAAMNRFFNFLNKNLIQSTFEFDKNLSQINKDLGGLGKEFEQVGMVSAGFFKGANTADLAMYGAGIKELGKAYGDLSNKVNGFNSFSKDQRELLAKNAVAMETLGVSSQTYASLTSTFMGALGKNAQGAKNVIEGLAKDAIAAGRSVAEYTREFEQVLPKIVGYGREATRIFKELNAFASMTKGVLSTGDLQSFASQFDNWDSAAESVSKLNVALGGASVNIADLMKADPSEKLMMLKRAFDESEQDFDKLNVGYKRMLAEGFGGDVNKAGAFFKGNIADANAEMEKMAANEAELEERRKKSTEATEKLAKALDSIKIAFTPMLDFIAGIAEKVAKFVNNFGPISSFFLVAMPLALLAFRGAIKLTGAMMSATFNTVTDDTKKRILEVIELARQARTEINSMNTPMPGSGTPSGTPPAPGIPPSPGTPPSPSPTTPGGAKPGLFRRMGGSIGIGGAIMLLGAASNAYSNITATNTVTNPKFLKNDEDGEEKLPVGNALGINTHKTILEQDPDTGFLNPIARANKQDKAVELRTPGELSDQAKQIGVAVGKEIEVNNTQLSQNMSKQNESFYSATSEKLETIREVSQTKIDFNGMFTGAKFVAAIDPNDLERNNRAVISQAEEYINTRQNSKA